MNTFSRVLLFMGIGAHIAYYISPLWGINLSPLFENVTWGQDFFQVPNAAYAFWRGGTLLGQTPEGVNPYTDCCAINANVYHPLFTLLVGSPLSFLPPWTAFFLWRGIHAVLTIGTLAFLWKYYSNHKHVMIALSLFLLNSFHYYEVQLAQYHFLFNFFALLFLFELTETKNETKAGFWLFLSLLVKPIGLLWIVPLIIGKKIHTVLIASILFLVTTIPFIMLQDGRYYFYSLISNVIRISPNFNLIALTHFLPLPILFFRYISLFTAIGLILLQITRRLHLVGILFLWVVFQLFFYRLVFPYHYTIIATFLAFGILSRVFFIRWVDVFLMVVLSLPPPMIYYFHLRGSPSILPTKELSLAALWTVFWLFLFCVRHIQFAYAQKSKRVLQA